MVQNSEITGARELTVAMPWGVIAMKTWNSSDLEPMLMLHGVRDNAATYDQLIPLLSPDYFYVSVDLPGHGFSTALSPGLPVSYMSTVLAIQRLIHHFSWESFSLMGHSLGAALALTLAEAEYRKVNRLIFIDGLVVAPLSDEGYLMRSTRELHDLLENEKFVLSQSSIFNYEDVMKFYTERIFPTTEKAAEAMIARSFVKAKDGYYFIGDRRPYTNVKPYMSENIHLYHSTTIRFPVLVILPKESPILPIIGGSEFLQKMMHNLLNSHALSKLEHVTGDHCLQCNEPDQMASVINDFLKTTSGFKICQVYSKL